MKRVTVIVSARPSWAKLEPVVEQLFTDTHVEVDLVATAYALVHRFGRVVDVMRQQFSEVTELHSAADMSGVLETSAQTTAMTTIQFGQYFRLVQPAAVVICADRHETLGVSIAASYQNIPIVHLQGGEVSGNIDHKVRWANSMLADWHAAATEQAKLKLIGAGLDPERVAWTGCPSIDLARQALEQPPINSWDLDHVGVGGHVEPRHPFVLVVQHPETEKPHKAAQAMQATIGKALRLQLPMVVLWPGADVGHEAAAKVLREFQQQFKISDSPVRFIRTLPPRKFLRLLSQATLAIGNSSALVREASYLGTTVELVGTRQANRETGGKYLYGDGFAAERVARLIYRSTGDVSYGLSEVA